MPWTDTGRLQSKPQPNLPATVMHNPLTQQPIKRVHAAAANDDDSDDVSVASQQIDDARALRMFNDQERAKASQRRDVIDKTIRFQPGLTYLHNFIEVTSSLLQSKHFLEDKEKAQLLVHMLDNSVKDKLKGDARIINPSHPAQVFELLRNTYPVNQQQLSTDLAGITQGTKQDAAPFTDGIKAKYIMHGVPLPTTHSQYLTMHLKFNTKFSQHMQNYDNQVTFDRQKNKQPAGDYKFSWEDFSRQAAQFDQQQTLMRSTREVMSISDTPPTRGRIRSASISRVNALHAEEKYQSKSDSERSPRPLRERYAADQAGASRPPYVRRYDSRQGNTGTGYRPDRPRLEKSRFSANKPEERGRTPYRKGSLISGPDRDPKKVARITAAQDEASGSDPEQHDHAQSEEEYESFQEQDVDSADESETDDVDLLQAFPIQLSVMQPQTLDSRDDSSPMVISTIAKSVDGVHVSAAQRTGGNRPVMPEGISQEEMETPLSEAVHKGFRNVRNSPHNDPVGKVLNAQFTLNFRQLASLSLDRQSQEICGRLLKMGTSEEELQASVAQAAAASQVMQVACHSFFTPAPEGAMPIASAAATSASQVAQVVSHYTVAMTTLQGCVDLQGAQPRQFKLDSGAAISCISTCAFQQDKAHLLVCGKELSVTKGLMVTGFDKSCASINKLIHNPVLMIGTAACRHSLLVVPNLCCDYLLGQDFIVTYDLQLNYKLGVADMGVPEEEWIGMGSNPGRQTINIAWKSKVKKFQVQ